MWLIIGLVLLLMWAGGFFMFHVASIFIHILIVLAIISVIAHFLTGRSRV